MNRVAPGRSLLPTPPCLACAKTSSCTALTCALVSYMVSSPFHEDRGLAWRHHLSRAAATARTSLDIRIFAPAFYLVASPSFSPHVPFSENLLLRTYPCTSYARIHVCTHLLALSFVNEDLLWPSTVVFFLISCDALPQLASYFFTFFFWFGCTWHTGLGIMCMCTAGVYRGCVQNWYMMSALPLLQPPP